MEDRKRKMGIIAASSVVLVAMAVILVVACTGGNDEKPPDVSASQRAIMSICDTTDYQQTCLDSLAGHNSSDPKALIEVAIQSSINHIEEAVKNSTAIHDAEKTPRGRLALETCRELANRAVDDLDRSFGTFDDFDITSVADVPLELKIWLSGAITQLETCLDSFEDVPGDAGNRMRQVLRESMEMTSNVLTMVAEISTFLDSMGGGGGAQTAVTSRRLLSTDEFLPEWVDAGKRKLLAATPQVVTPDLIVAKDGTGNYPTINEALKNIPKSGKNKTIVLYIREGVYEEKLQFNSSMKNLFVIGDGPTKTRITGKSNFIDGTNTYQTATVAVQGDDFIARDIGFENTAGPEKHQAVALRVSADKAIFYNCHMDAYQDTLYAHAYRQFYRNCRISGTIDFIFGDSAAVFQNCTLLVRKPLENQQCVVTAQGRKEIRQPTGFILQNCSIRPDRDLYAIRKNIKTYLGRPWKQYSRTVIMESFLDDLICPTGWLPWNGTFALDTLFYTEFNNRGPAAPKKQRARWPGVKELPSSRIQRFTAVEFLDGNGWIPRTQVPYTPGFVFPVPKDDPNVKYSPIVPEETKDLGPKVEQMKHLSPPKDGKQNALPSSHANVPQNGSTGAPSTIGSTTTSTPSSNTAPPPAIPPSASTVVIVETNVTALKTAANATSPSPIGGSNASRVPDGGNHPASAPMHMPNYLGNNSDETMMAKTPNSKPDAPKGDTTHAAKISASAPNAAAFKPGSSESDRVSSAPNTLLVGSSAPPPMTSSDDGSAAPPPQAHKSAPSQSSPYKDLASSPSNIDVTAPPPISLSGGSTSQLPQSGNIIAKASPRGNSPSPASTDSTTPPPPSSISSRSSSQSLPKNQAKPPTVSPSGRPNPSSPESGNTAPPPDSQGTASSPPPPSASEATTPPSKSKDKGSAASSPPQSEETTPPSNSKDKGSAASPPASEATTPPSNSKDKASAPSPPQSEATAPPSSSKDKVSPPSPPQSEATTPPSNSKDKASAPSPPQLEATTPPSNSKNKASAPSPPQSEATTLPSNSKDKASAPSPPQSEATTPPSNSKDKASAPSPPQSEATTPPANSKDKASVPSPPQSEATTTPSNSQDEVFVPPPSQSEATTPPSTSHDGAPPVPSPPRSDFNSQLPTPPSGEKTQSPPPSYSLHVVSPPSQSGRNPGAQSTPQSDTSSPPAPTSQPQSDTSPPPTSSSSGSIPPPPPSGAATPPMVNSISSTQSM
ncbi:hypothetical protein M569_05708 [Genlisea aurea]|uniref:pectinesterase n=1 Tax=Genlisea aurea TaxID=192259 RepID=S8CPF5_9LAMI|nr:hypothetical protein M569_05708 [Genlisea aurea]